MTEIKGAYAQGEFYEGQVSLEASGVVGQEHTAELDVWPSWPAGPVFLDVKGLVQLAASALALAAKLNGKADDGRT